MDTFKETVDFIILIGGLIVLPIGILYLGKNCWWLIIAWMLALVVSLATD